MHELCQLGITIACIIVLFYTLYCRQQVIFYVILKKLVLCFWTVKKFLTVLYPGHPFYFFTKTFVRCFTPQKLMLTCGRRVGVNSPIISTGFHLTDLLVKIRCFT